MKTKSSLFYGITLLVLGIVGLTAGFSAVATHEASAASPTADVKRVPVSWHAQAAAAGTGQVSGASARLIRTDNAISWTLNTSGLIPGHAYTVWLVVINNPGACTVRPCAPNPDVLVNTATTRSQIVYGGGHVAGGSGGASFGGSRQVGPIPNGWYGSTALENARTAEIHLVLNDHGPMIPQFMPGMIDTYRAGCTDASLPGIFPATAKADGAPGPNTCTLWQVALFQP
jgi:hypothetical protein